MNPPCIKQTVTLSVVEPHNNLRLATFRLTGLIFLLISFLFTSCDLSTKKEKPAKVLSPLDSIAGLIKANPEDAKLYDARAKVYIEKKDYSNALSDAATALRLDSTVSAYYVTISDVYFYTNEPVNCVGALKKALSLDPRNKEALIKISQFYLFLRRYEESVSFANTILEFDPNFSRAYFIKGQCYKDAGDTARAILNFREALDKDPKSYDACIMLAQLHYGLKDKLAITYYNNALNLQPKSLEAYYGIAMFYQETNELNRALETYATILSIDSSYKNAHYNVGYIHFEYLQKYNEALKYFDNAVKIDPTYFQAIYMRGLCYEKLGDVQRAKGEYSRALQINPSYQLALNQLNKLLKDQKKYSTRPK